MRHLRLPARVPRLARAIGPYGWAAAGLVAGALLAGEYLRRTRARRAQARDDLAVAQWETDGGGGVASGVPR